MHRPFAFSQDRLAQHERNIVSESGTSCVRPFAKLRASSEPFDTQAVRRFDKLSAGSELVEGRLSKETTCYSRQALSKSEQKVFCQD